MKDCVFCPKQHVAGMWDGDAETAVAHLHVHLVPRWHGDGTVGWPWPPPQDLAWLRCLPSCGADRAVADQAGLGDAPVA